MSLGLADLAATLTQATLCWRCGAATADISVKDFDEQLAGLRTSFVVEVTFAFCSGCGRDTLVYRIARRQPVYLATASTQRHSTF